jgi:intein/homing endonuclease
MLEHNSCLRYSPEEYEEIKAGLSNRLKELIPERFQYEGIPSFFQFTDAERIRSIILDKKRERLAVILSITLG